MGKITADRQIVEHLIDGNSLTLIQKLAQFQWRITVIAIRNKALEYNYIKPISADSKIYKYGVRKLLPFSRGYI